VTVSKGEIIILAGDFAVSTAESSFVVLRLYGKDLLTMKKVGTGISLSADIWNEDGKVLTTIEDNKFRVNANTTIPIIRPDPHTLMVDDERKTRVLSVRFLNPSTIKIAGVFRAGGKYPVIIGEHDITFGPLLIKDGFVFHVKGKSIFDWPGEISGSKRFFAPVDRIEADKFVAGIAWKDGTFNVILKNSKGDEYSIFQIGGPDVPEGTELWPVVGFQVRSSN
jgi:hypothetical protein